MTLAERNEILERKKKPNEANELQTKMKREQGTKFFTQVYLNKRFSLCDFAFDWKTNYCTM